MTNPLSVNTPKLLRRWKHAARKWNRYVLFLIAIARNFDFEGGRIFDEEKIMKWVFPDKCYKFLSIIWAGMVGGVTGVNEHRLYISINAAGSDEYVRYGTPTTLVLLEALRNRE